MPGLADVAADFVPQARTEYPMPPLGGESSSSDEFAEMPRTVESTSSEGFPGLMRAEGVSDSPSSDGSSEDTFEDIINRIPRGVSKSRNITRHMLLLVAEVLQQDAQVQAEEAEPVRPLAVTGRGDL